MSLLIYESGLRYWSDVSYFVNQISMYADYHRQLYSQVQFPYGPLLYYPVSLLRSALSHWNVSLEVSYLVILCLQQFLGVCLLAYVVNALPMSRGWKIFALACFGIWALQPNLGLNYTLFRFMSPTAALIFCIRRKTPLRVAVLFIVGAVFALGVSPEMGFAFTAGAMAYAVLRVWRSGIAWLPAVFTPLLGCVAFLLLIGKPYLTMLGLFAHGTYNQIVEPLPHTLIVLFALVWLVPTMLAHRFRQHEEDAFVLAACFVVSLALLPVAFGRADPIHVLFDGAPVLLLSMPAIASYSRKKQIVWGVCMAATVFFGLARAYRGYQISIVGIVCTDIAQHPDSIVMRGLQRVSPSLARKALKDQIVQQPLDMDALRKLVGNNPVATPFTLSLLAENQLKAAGLYRPDTYFFMFAVFDDSDEVRKIDEFNQAKWALVKNDGFLYSEDQSAADVYMGIPLPYRPKRPSYVIGKKFADNLKSRWEPVGVIGDYTVYRQQGQ